MSLTKYLQKGIIPMSMSQEDRFWQSNIFTIHKIDASLPSILREEGV
jgi:hypothetical protein